MAATDLHLHTHCSDGRLAPADLVARVAEAGVTCCSITDHDTMAAYADALPAAEAAGIELIPGVELSTRYDGADAHLLVYGLPADDPFLAPVLESQKRIRYSRMQDLLSGLGRDGVRIPIDRVAAEAGHWVLGRVHLARVLVADGHATDIRDAFDRWLGRRHTLPVSPFPELLPLLPAIREAGGVSVLAHPGRNYSYLDLRRFVLGGLQGIEVRHPSHAEAKERSFRNYARLTGLIPTGGSDFHGHKPGDTDHIGRFGLAPAELEPLRNRLALSA